MIPTFWDLMKEMQKQEIVEAKHFDVTLKFIKDLSKFVQSNTDTLKNKQVSELNIKANSLLKSKKKKIQKNG